MEMGDVAVLPSTSHEEDAFVITPGKETARAPQVSQERTTRVPRIQSFSIATNNNSEANHNNHKISPKVSPSHHHDSDNSSTLSPYTPPGSPEASHHASRVIKIRTIGNYCIERTIGRGQFGKVKLAYHKRVPEMKVAIKIINKTKLDEDTLRMIQREVRIMKLMNHPHIIKLYEVIETAKMFFLIMEYAEGGEVMDFIIAHGRIPEREARRFFIQMLSAVEYCHSKRCVHRDLKPENLLLDCNMNVKIIDFGLSNVFSPGSLLKTFCGSPTYASPELILRKEYFGPAVDVWSMGVVLYVLVCGYLPFDGHNFNELFHKILKVQYTIPSHVSPDCSTLIRRMLVVDPTQRITIEEIRQRTWLGPLSGYLPITASADIDDVSRVDKETVSEMVPFGYNADDVVQSLLNNRYDDAAAMYYLLDSKRKRKNSNSLRTHSYEKMSASIKESQAEAKESIPPALPTVPVARFKKGHRRNNTVDTCSSPEETTKHATPTVTKEKEEATKEKKGGFHMRTLIRSGHTPPRGKNHRRAASEAMKEDMIQQAKNHAQQQQHEDRLALEPVKSHPLSTSPQQQIVEDDWVLLGTATTSSSSSHTGEQKQASDEEEATIARSPSKSTVSSIFSSIKSMWKHKPASSQQQPRVVRFAFTLNTTSDKSADEIIGEVQRVLHEFNIRYTMKSAFMADCVVDNVRFTVEVCRLPRLLVSGIRLSRISGSAWKYKTIAKDFMAQLKL